MNDGVDSVVVENITCRKKEERKVGTYTMKRVAAGAPLPVVLTLAF